MPEYGTPNYRTPHRTEVRNEFDCPKCGAKAGNQCREKSKLVAKVHQDRMNLWYDKHQGGVGARRQTP
jgi:hypothetical protein